MSVAWSATGGSSGVLLRRLTSGPETWRAAAAATAAARRQAAATAAVRATLSRTHLFHTSSACLARRRRRFSNVLASEMGLVDEEAIGQFSKEHFPGYTAADKAVLRGKYTPAQLAAIEAGEAAVASRDLTVQGRLRTDNQAAGLTYVDDFALVQPTIDERPRPMAQQAAAAATMEGARFMDEAAFGQDLLAWLETFVPKNVNLAGLSDEQLRAVAAEHGPKDADLMHWWFDRPAVVQRDGRTRVPLAAMGTTGLAPALGEQIPGVTEHFARKASAAGEDGNGEAAGGAGSRLDDDATADEIKRFGDLQRMTGLLVSEIRGLAVKTLVTRTVHNQTRLGKVRSIWALVMAGNGDGRLGLGVAKSRDRQEAVTKARAKALRNMRPIRRYENRTIYGVSEAKIAGTVVQLYARPPGFGLRLPPRIFELARAVGITDLAARIPRSRNAMNSVKAAYLALVQQPDPEEIAMGRGKKLVDVRKVYYGGAVY